MTVLAEPAPGGSAQRQGSLYDTIELILDKGVVIDAFVRLSLIGIELIKLEVRVVIASVDTFLRYAETVSRIEAQRGDPIAQLIPGSRDTRPALGRGGLQPIPQELLSKDANPSRVVT